MSTNPPKIDRRSYQDLVKQTKDLAEQYTAWRALADDQTDAGLALIRIFGRMAALVSDRLNRVPDRNLLAFINLIGTQLTPPQPARVPLTFNLAGGSPVDALVPAHTQVSAPAPVGEKEEIVFETEKSLLVTSAKLQAIFVVEDRDYYSDRTVEATGNKDAAFLAFKGEKPVEHFLYLHAEEIFNLPELKTITITIETDSPESAIKLKQWLHLWSYWEQTSWQPFTNIQTQEIEHRLIVTLTELPKLMPVEINGQKAQWLRTSLKPYHRDNLPEITQINISTSIDQTQPPQLCLFNNSSLDLSKDFYPFGLAPLHNDTFSIALDDKLIKPGVSIEININLSHQPSHSHDLEIIWEVGNGQEWQIIEQTIIDRDKFIWSQNSSPLKFLETTTSVTFQFPQTLTNPNSVADRGENYYWLRGRITNGIYGIKGRERKYVFYNDATIVAQNIAIGQPDIFVDSVDELEIGDIIRIQSSTDQTQQEETKIIGKIPADKKLILDNNTRHQYATGSRILSKFIMAENTPDRFDPPLVASLTLTYKFVLEKPAVYYAYNDFIYSQGTPVDVRLNQSTKAGEIVALLTDVSQLVVGEILKFGDRYPEKRQIELIDRERNLVIFTQPLNYEHQRTVRVIRCFHPLTPQLNRNSALYLGFNQPFNNQQTTLYLQVEPPQPQEVAPNINRGDAQTAPMRIVWEYASPNGWQSLSVQDETQALAQTGLLQFIGPTNFISVPYFGQQLYWLRGRKKANDWGDIPFSLIYFFKWALEFRELNLFSLIRYLSIRVSLSVDFPVPPRLRSVRTNTTWATQTITLENEILGSSNGEPKQVFAPSQIPILLEQQLEVQEGKMPSDDDRLVIEAQSGLNAIASIIDETGRMEAVWVRWQEVPDFYNSQTKDRHYIVDRQSGKIQFGDGQSGMIPPRGRNNIRLIKYRTGGGFWGNTAAQTITELKTTIPYIDSAINPEAATGGTEQESLEHLKERSPQRLRHCDRAVTAQDFADLALETSLDVARVKIITPEMVVPNFNPLLEELWLEPEKNGQVSQKKTNIEGNEIKVFNHEIRAGIVHAIIVPHSVDRQPTPSLTLLTRVEQYLQARFVPTMKLRVSGPKWQEIRVITEIVPVSLENADSVILAVSDRLHSFLHPLTGGTQGLGWSFGRKPHHSDLYAVIEAVPGVNYVRALDIQPANIIIDQWTLIYSGSHLVTLKLPGDID